MKKIVVLSDTHGNISAIESLKSIMAESDYIFHLGDYQRDILCFKEFGDKIYSVKGNCDGGGEDLILDIEEVKVLLTHGDKYSVKNGLEGLFFKAKELGVDAVFFGHTHQALIENQEGVCFINPGCAKGFFEKTYCYTVIHGKQIVSKIAPINR